MRISTVTAASCIAMLAALSVTSSFAEEGDGDRGHVYRPDANTNAPDIGDIEPQEFNLDDYVGFTYRSKPIIDLDGVVGQIDSGARDPVNAGIITYSFLEMDHLTGIFNNPQYGFTAGNGVGPLSEAQRVVARESIGLWDDLVAHSFVEKNGQGADIRFANSADPAQAYAYYPNDQYGYKIFGDVFLADPALNWTNNWLGYNGYGATTIIHELGHSQGMSHPGAYNFAPNIPLNYDGLAEYAQDSEQYSIMSYWDPDETGAVVIDWSSFFFGNAQTPLLHDIYVVQSMYGADPATRTGDTTYGYNSTAGRDVYDFTKNHYPSLSIYDAGGIDTLDMSGSNGGVFIDLHDGAFSSGSLGVPDAALVAARRAELAAISGLAIGPIPQPNIDAIVGSWQNFISTLIAADTGVTGVRASSYDNLSIAYGTVIENAKGGSARDVLWGNEAANVLTGNGGDDVLNGFEGADTYVGGAGYDVHMFSHLESGDSVADFMTNEDKLDLRGTGVSFTYVGNAAFTNTAGELRYDNGVLEGDADGDGIADISIDLGNAPLAATDLVL